MMVFHHSQMTHKGVNLLHCSLSNPHLGEKLLLEPDLGSVVVGLQSHDDEAPAPSGTLAGVLTGLLPVEHGQVSLRTSSYSL